jgi:hypothetical protein
MCKFLFKKLWPSKMQAKAISDNIISNASISYQETIKLIHYFNSIRPGQEFKEMEANMELAYSIVGVREIIENIAIYMLKFRVPILNSDVGAIYNYEYDTLIEKNTLSSTRQLIMSLIESMRTIWLMANERQRLVIKNSIQKLLLYCIKHEEYVAALKHA